MNFLSLDKDKYEDRHRERLKAVIKSKGEGREIEVEEEEGTPADVPDLMAALEATLAKRKEHTPGTKPKGTKEDLLEQARELDIEGRSKMTKDELADAIAAAR